MDIISATSLFPLIIFFKPLLTQRRRIELRYCCSFLILLLGWKKKSMSKHMELKPFFLCCKEDWVANLFPRGCFSPQSDKNRRRVRTLEESTAAYQLPSSNIVVTERFCCQAAACRLCLSKQNLINSWYRERKKKDFMANLTAPRASGCINLAVDKLTWRYHLSQRQ